MHRSRTRLGCVVGLGSGSFRTHLVDPWSALCSSRSQTTLLCGACTNMATSQERNPHHNSFGGASDPHSASRFPANTSHTPGPTLVVGRRLRSFVQIHHEIQKEDSQYVYTSDVTCMVTVWQSVSRAAKIFNRSNTRAEGISESFGSIASGRMLEPLYILTLPYVISLRTPLFHDFTATMSIPLDFVGSLPTPKEGLSLGDHVAEHVTDCGRVTTFLDCMPTTTKPALYSPDTAREPLRHYAIHDFVSKFSLPCSTPSSRLGPNDRIMVALPTTPENGLALLALACYHTTAPVNATCTAAELFEDAERLGAKAVFSTEDAEERLELRNMQEKLGCEIIYMEGRESGPAGLFDMWLMDDPDGLIDPPPTPSKLHGLEDQSLVLHTSGTSGKKKVVPYSLRSLIIGTCSVVASWDLKEVDVNSKSSSTASYERRSHSSLSEYDAPVPRWRYRAQSLRANSLRRQRDHVRRFRRSGVLVTLDGTWLYMVCFEICSVSSLFTLRSGTMPHLPCIRRSSARDPKAS